MGVFACLGFDNIDSISAREIGTFDKTKDPYIVSIIAFHRNRYSMRGFMGIVRSLLRRRSIAARSSERILLMVYETVFINPS